ncbi:MAG: hypothetical protein K2O45_16155 [Oscillospiraceae bacterium]|nr:hypothetical protein [Oscillospiraceae bacterium]
MMKSAASLPGRNPGTAAVLGAMVKFFLSFFFQEKGAALICFLKKILVKRKKGIAKFEKI